MEKSMKDNGKITKRTEQVTPIKNPLGTLESPNGETYKGQWRANKKDGKGNTSIKIL